PTQLPRLMDAAARVSHSSPAYPSIAYYLVQLDLELGKKADAGRIVDEMLEMGDRLPISTHNTLIDLERKFVTGLDDFIVYSLKKPFAFDFDGEVGTIDEFIARQKTYYDPEVNKDG